MWSEKEKKIAHFAISAGKVANGVELSESIAKQIQAGQSDDVDKTVLKLTSAHVIDAHGGPAVRNSEPDAPTNHPAAKLWYTKAENWHEVE